MEAGAFWSGERSVGSGWPQVMLGSRAQAAEGSWKGAQRRGGGTQSHGSQS